MLWVDGEESRQGHLEITGPASLSKRRFGLEPLSNRRIEGAEVQLPSVLEERGEEPLLLRDDVDHHVHVAMRSLEYLITGDVGGSGVGERAEPVEEVAMALDQDCVPDAESTEAVRGVDHGLLPGKDPWEDLGAEVGSELSGWDDARPARIVGANGIANKTSAMFLAVGGELRRTVTSLEAEAPTLAAGVWL